MNKPFFYPLATILIACFIPIFQFPAVFLGDHIFGHPDFFGFSIPIKQFFFNGLANHELKFFYPYNLLGTSLFSGPHYQTFYLPNFIWIIASPQLAFKIVYFIHYPIFALGLFLFLKELKFSNQASFATSILTTSCGIIWSMHVHPNEFDATSWLPWSFFFFFQGLNHDATQYHSKIKFIYLPPLLKKSLFLFLSAFSLLQSYLAGDPWSLAFGYCFLIVFYLLFNSEKKNPIKSAFRMSRQKLLSIFIFSILLFVLCAPFYFLHSMSSLLTERQTGFSSQETFMYSNHWLRLPEFFVPWLIPGFDSPDYPWKESLKQVNPGAWYYEIGYGVIFGFAFLLGLLQTSFKKSTKFLPYMFLFLVIFCMFYLSTGINSELNPWIWKQLPTLSSLRFPERLLKYMLIPVAIISCTGFSWIFQYTLQSRKFAKFANPQMLNFALISLAFFEINLSFILPNTISSSINSYPTDLVKLNYDSRLLTCENGFSPHFPTQKPLAINFHPIAWGLSTVYEAEAMVQTMNKTIDCKIALKNHLREWMGFTHILSPYYDDDTSKLIESTYEITKIQSNKEANFNLYQVNPQATKEALLSTKFIQSSILFDEHNPSKLNSSNEKIASKFNQLIEDNFMFFDPNIYLNENGLLHFEKHKENVPKFNAPTPSCTVHDNSQKIPINVHSNYQFISVQYQSSCENTLLIIPYAFTIGWRAFINDKPVKIYRVNDWVMGVMLGEGENNIVFKHSFPRIFD